MAKLALPPGITSRTVNIFIADSASTTGAGKTGIAYNTSSFTAYYVRPKAAAVSITLATQTVTGAFSSGGFVEIDATNMPGMYRFDIPDAALAVGVDSVAIMFKGASGMAPLLLEIDLITLAASVIRMATAQGGAANSITLDASASASNVYDPGYVLIVSGTGAGQTREILDYNTTTKVATVSRSWKVNPDSTSVFAIIPGGPLIHSNEGIAQAGGANTITLNATAASVNDAIKGQIVYIVGGTGVDQAGVIDSYNGTTKVATMTANWGTAPDNTSVYILIPTGASMVFGYDTGKAPLDAAGTRSAVGLATANLDTQLTTIDDFLDTEVAAIKAKTDNLPSDPADASDIAASFASIASTLSTLTAYVDTEVAAILAAVDTEVAAIKAKTDSLTFTVSGQVDSNIQYVNDVQVAGTGAPGDEWGP